MAYPKAPWKLQGYAIQTGQLVDIEQARPFIPQEFEIISVLPGKTLGGVYASRYEPGSALEYSELIVVAGLVSYAGNGGAWISHIYVDHPDSVAGGREIWGLPKELAEFTWDNREDSSQVSVRQGNRKLCRFSTTNMVLPFSTGFPLPLSGPVLSALNSDVLMFKGEFNSPLELVNGKLDIPAESPFRSLNLDKPLLTVQCQSLQILVNAPEVVGQKSVNFSYQ